MRLVVVTSGGRRGLCLILLGGCLILGALGPGAVDAHAATPSSLAGETFTSHEVKGSTLSGTCTKVTSEGHVNFSVSGTAAGPFPGTFTESGSFSTTRGGSFSSFSSTFTITSTAGTVTGTASLPQNGFGTASCFQVGGTVVDVSIDDLGINYSATLPGGGQDTGTATVTMLGVLGSELVSYTESFGSAGGPPPPTSKAQCKHGGWRSFGTMFKNQGDCVSFVATGGKNPPSGSKPMAQYTVCQSGCPYDDLQNAILAVENGTITNPITVGPGDYLDTSVFVTGTVVIRGVGDGSGGTILDGSGIGSVIGVEKPGSLTISGVEITNGNNDEEGGGISNDGGTVIFDGPVSITNNAATDGGGIFNDRGTVTFAAGSNVSITDNSAAAAGGGIFNHLGTVTFDVGSNVSISGNTPDNCVGTTSCP